MSSTQSYETINKVLSGKYKDGLFGSTVKLNYNGDIQPISVSVREGKISIEKDNPIYPDLHGYKIENNKLSIYQELDEDALDEFTEQLVYDLARLLEPSWLENILNINKDLLTPEFVLSIYEDPNRGYVHRMIVYRDGGSDFVVKSGSGPLVVPSTFDGWFDDDSDVEYI